MKWRNTLAHESGTVVASEFEGLKAAIIGLTRHSDFHTLVKEFKSSFRAYGSNGMQDGRRDWIKNIESTFGPDSVIEVLIEYAPDNYTFQTLYEGEIGIQTIVEGLEFDHYLEFTPVQTGYWRKFISRYDVPVNIQSATNLDGIAVTVYTPETLSLPNQVITYYGEYNWLYSFDYWNPAGGGSFDTLQLDWDGIVRDDLNKFSIGRGLNESITLQESIDSLVGNFPAPFDGSYRIEVKMISAVLSTVFTIGWADLAGLSTLYLSVIGSDTRIDIGNETVVSPGAPTNSYLITEADYTIELKKGDQVSIFLEDGGRNIFGIKQLTWKTRVDVMTVLNTVLSGEQTIDGVLTSSSDVLLIGQGVSSENGIYTTSAGVWTRRSDTNTGALITLAAVKIISGTDFSNTFWKQIEDVINISTDEQRWEEIPSSGSPVGNLEEFAFTDYGVVYDGPTVENYLRVTAETTFPDSEAQSFLQHDVAAAILDRITEPDKLYSPLIGSQYTKARTYAEAGTWWNNALLKGVHARGYTLSEKLFSLSFKDFWEGFAPMFNPSLGYEIIDGQERIVIRTKAEAYDSSSMSVLLSGVQRIKRKYGTDYFNAVDVGFAKGKTEDISGIDDTQKESRASILKNIGRKISILTNWIAQGLTIEQARRTTRIKSADYKFDDDTFIVEVTRTGESTYNPRLNEDFSSVTNLLNEETRYNKHHTPARFLLRWFDYLSGGLQKYIGTVFRFTGGEGNYDMISEMVPGSAPDDYNGDPLAENANIPVGTTYLWIPKVFEIDHYLTFEEFQTIDANRNLSIGISQTYEDHSPFFIDDLQLELMTGQLKLIGKFKNEFDIITVPPGSQIFQGGKIFDSTFDFSWE